MMISPIKITSSSETSQIESEFIKRINEADLNIKFQSEEIEAEEELLTCIANQLKNISSLSRLSLVFAKYSIFRQFNTLTSGLPHLKNLTELSITLKGPSMFSDNHLKDLTDSIVQLPNLIKFTLWVKKGSLISSDSYAYINNCVLSLTQLKVLNLQIEHNTYYQKETALLGLSKALQSSQQLTELSLLVDTRYSGSINFQVFGDSIASHVNLQKLELRLLYAENQKFTIKILMSLISNLKRLTKLRIVNESDFNPILDTDEIKSIQHCLAELKHLESLAIKNIIDNQVLYVLNSLNSLSPLLEWEQMIDIIASTTYKCDEQTLDQFFLKFTNLKKLVLEVQRLGTLSPKHFFQSLALGFSHMLSLENIYIFDSEYPSRIEFNLLFREIMNLTRLKSLSLVSQYQKIDQESINSLGSSLSELTQLENLKLEFSLQENVNTNLLIKSICKQVKLTELSLPFIDSSDFFDFPSEFQNLSALKQLNIKGVGKPRVKKEYQEYEDEQIIEDENKKIIDEEQIIEDEDQDEYKIEDKDGQIIEEKNEQIKEEISDNLMHFFQNLSQLSDLRVIDLEIRSVLSQMSSVVLRDAILELKKLQRAAFCFEEISQSNLNEIMKGFENKNLDCLSLRITNLEGSFEQVKVPFGTLSTLKHFEFNVSKFNKSEKNFKMIKHLLDQLKNVSKLKLILQEIPYDLLFILREFLYRSPQLLSLCIQDNNDRKWSDSQIAQEGQEFFDLQKLQNHKLRTIRLSVVKLNEKEAACFQQLNNIKEIFLDVKMVSSDNQEKQSSLRNTCWAENQQTQQSKYLYDLNINIPLQWMKRLENNICLKLLNINKQYLKNQDVYQLGVSLQKLETIENLDLNVKFEETVDKESLNELSKGIKNQKNLNYLDISFCSSDKIDSNGLASLMGSLKYVKNLLSLRLNIKKNNKCDNTWLVSLGKSLSSIIYLENLEISLKLLERKEEQQIGKGIQSIGDSFKFLTYLSILEINFKKTLMVIEEQGAISLGRGISNLSNLSELKLSFGKSVLLQQNGGMYITEGVANLNYLNFISISFQEDSSIQSQTIHRLTSNLHKMNKLQVIKLKIQDIHPGGMQFDLETFLKSQELQNQFRLSLDLNLQQISMELYSSFPLLITLKCSSMLDNVDSLLNQSILQKLSIFNKFPIKLDVELDISRDGYDQQIRTYLVQQLTLLSVSTLTIKLFSSDQFPLTETFRAISKIKNLKELSIDLNDCKQLRDIQQSIELLKSSQELYKLELEYDKLGFMLKDTVFQIISGIPKLSKLRTFILKFWYIECKLSVYKKLMKSSISLVNIVVNNTRFLDCGQDQEIQQISNRDQDFEDLDSDDFRKEDFEDFNEDSDNQLSEHSQQEEEDPSNEDCLEL